MSPRAEQAPRAALLALVLLGCSGPSTTIETPDASAPAPFAAPERTDDALSIASHIASTMAPLRARIRSAREWMRQGDALHAMGKGAVDVVLAGTASGATTISAHDDPELRLDVTPEGAAASTAEPGAQSVVYRDAFDAVDVLDLALEDGFEELRIVRRPMDRFTARYRLHRGPKLTKLRLRSGLVEALDASGRTRFTSERIFALDADGTRRDAKLELLADGDDHVLVVTLDTHGLRAPFVVDPGWVQTKGMLATRSGPDLAVTGNKVLIVGGGGLATVPVADLYDVAANTMTNVSPTSGYPQGLSSSHAMAALADGRVIVAGGYTQTGSYTTQGALFDPATNGWTSRNGLSIGRADLQAIRLGNGKVLFAGGMYVGAGSTTVRVSAAELFDATTGFSVTGSMATARSSHRLVLLPSGKVLVVGGGTSSAEIFNGSTWSSAAPMSVVRSSPVAVALANGKVLVAGGYNGTLWQKTAEIYDEALNAWTPAASLLTARGDGASARLPSGRVLAAAGATGTDGAATGTSEIYDPIADTWKATSSTGAFRSLAFGVLADGRVFMAGGTSGSPTYSSTLQTWTFTEGQLGDTEATPGDCASGFAVDGVCCNTACTAQCQACNVAGSSGTCSNVTGKPVGSRATCAPYACNGAGACATSCTADAQCDPTYYCATGACVAKKAQGVACTATNQCTSGNCVDGYCCNSACGDQCARCDGTVKGTCSATFGAPVGARTTCAGFGIGTTCGFQCNGADTVACHYPPNTTSCSSNACNPSAAGGPEETRASQCDGNGGCNDIPKKCGTYVCGTNACKSSCTGEADCAPGFICQTGVCTVGSGPTIGSSCTTGANCPTSTFCTDNVCCASATCDAGSSCATVGKKGYCAKLPGSACTLAGECGSGFCVDNVCCDRACAGQCEACNGVGTSGTCTAVVGAPRGGRAACAGGGVDACLGRACNGTNALACDGFVSTEVACRAASCVGATFSPAATCNGAGACGSPPSSSCSPYACDASACRTNCTADAHCASGFVCSGSACVPGTTKSLGDACTDASTCPTGAFCTDGVCCTTQVCGAGLACNTPKKLGTCAKAAGIECKADAECGTAACADGVCCDRACPGQCEACDVTGSVGTCSPVKGAPRGTKTACPTDAANVCASAACDGIDRASCAGRPGAETKCREPKCEAGTATPASYCNGSGTCGESSASSCGGYGCDAATKACRTGCTVSSDCASGYDCEGGSCTPTANKCSDDGTMVIQPDGQKIVCDATRCRAGNCIERCTLTDDCAVGYVCGGDGTCTRPSSTSEDSGGCTTGPIGAPSRGSLAFLLLCLGLLRRRLALAQ